MHRRQAVRDAVLTALAGIAATLTAGRVYPDGYDALPWINVATGAEDVEVEVDAIGISFPHQVRRLTVGFDLRVSAESDQNIDDDLDDLALEVERALADPTLGGLVDEWRYAGAEDVELSDEIEAPLALRTLTYEATYRVDTRDPI